MSDTEITIEVTKDSVLPDTARLFEGYSVVFDVKGIQADEVVKIRFDKGGPFKRLKNPNNPKRGVLRRVGPGPVRTGVSDDTGDFTYAVEFFSFDDATKKRHLDPTIKIMR